MGFPEFHTDQKRLTLQLSVYKAREQGHRAPGKQPSGLFSVVRAPGKLSGGEFLVVRAPGKLSSGEFLARTGRQAPVERVGRPLSMGPAGPWEQP